MLNKRNLLTSVVVVVLVFALAVSLRLVGKQIRLFTGASGENSKISFATTFLNTTQSTTVGQRISVPIWINTDNADIGGVDVLVRFDNTKLSLETVTPDPANNANLTLDTFAPVVSTNVSQFDTARVISAANSSGLVEFGAVTFQANPDPGQVTAPFRGTAQLAMLEFKALAADPASIIRFDVTQDSTTDTNMVTTGTVQDLFANTAWNATDNRISEMTVTINQTGGITPTVGTTPTLAATPTIATQPTNTPIATPTVTGSALDFRINFQGVTVDRGSKNVEILLKQGTTTVHTFATVPVNFDSIAKVYRGTLNLANVTPGSYDVYIKGPIHKRKKMPTSINITSGETTNASWTTTILPTGDINGDNYVNITDYSLLAGQFAPGVIKSGNTSDLNFNTFVDLGDYSLLAGNFNILVPGD
jgi:hypothetical protein